MTHLSHNRRLFELLDEVADMTHEQRAAYLDVHCSDDPDLRSEVERLMANEGQHLTSDLAAVAPVLPEQSIGREVGPFVLLEKLGEGGMGSVYLARHNRLNMKVAVKFIKYGRFATEIEKQRFEVEQKSLSHLSHPNIVKIFDAGLLPDGQPYYAMEYIEGLPLNEYCDSAKLTLRKRITLFIQICQAIQHAHQNLVVHRDLKPNNILIQPDGAVKLLDFGIAKLLEESDVMVTSADERMMTLEYAAPEQISGGVITLATDIYGLGVVLYELLTGRRPFIRQDSAKNTLAQSILEKEPKRPSTIVSDTAQIPEIEQSIKKTRDTTPVKLSKQLEGDLDTIILKTLQKEPARRYGSVQEFADDLERYLQGLPVLARPDSVTYRLGKFVRRHRAGVFNAALVTFMMIAAGIFYLVNVTHARNEAEIALQRAERVTDFTISLFRPADPNVAQGDTLTASEILDRSRARIQLELQKEPEVLAEMLDVIGEIYGGLGQLHTAVELLSQSITLRRQWMDSHPGELSNSLKLLATVQIQLNDIEQAKANLDEAYSFAQRAYSTNNVHTGSLLDLLGHVAFAQGRYDDAEAYFKQAIAHFEGIQGNYDIKLYNQGLASALNNLGVILYYVRENLDESENFLQRANVLYDELHSDSLHTDLIYINNSLGEVNRGKKQFDKAITYYLNGLDISRKLLGDHLLTATIASNLSVAMTQKGCTEEIRTYLEEVLEIRKKVLDAHHPSMGLTYHNLASYLLSCEKKPAEAILLYEKALAIFDVSIKEDDLRRASVYYQLGEAHGMLGAYETALQYSRRALAIRQKELKAPHSLLGRTYASIGILYEKWNWSDSSEVYLQRGLNQFQETGGTDREGYTKTLNALTRQLVKNGRCDRALPLFDSYLQLLEDDNPENNAQRATIMEQKERCMTQHQS